jgi:adenylate cyclase class IV
MAEDPRVARNVKIAKVALGAVALAILAPGIYLALQGLVYGSIFLLLAGVVFYAAPVIAMKFANWRLKGIKYEARVNPIETLQNQYLEKMNALGLFRESIKKFEAAVLNFKTKVEKFTQEQPDEAERFQSQLNTMNKLLDYRKNKYRSAKKGLEEFEITIQKANTMWDMSQEAMKMNELAGLQTGDPFDKIKTDTALDSVTSSLNMAFADLEDSLLDSEEVSNKALAFNPSESIPGVVIHATPAAVKVRD